MTFLQFCHYLAQKDDAVGDFARDWIFDYKRPRGPRDWDTVRCYLEPIASSDAIEAAKKAWDRWNGTAHAGGK